MDLQKLAEPFDTWDIEWRIQRNGVSNGKPWAMVLAYITNRAIMERLDDVCGAENWQNEYKEWHGTSQLCGISIYIPQVHGMGQETKEAEWVTKWDGADATAIESTKGGLSDSMKRAGVQWGIGRYLYKLDTNFVDLIEGRSKDDNAVNVYVDKKNMHFIRPVLPEFSRPSKPLTTEELSKVILEPKKPATSPRKETDTLEDQLTAKKKELLDAVKAKGMDNEEFTELKLKTVGVKEEQSVITLNKKGKYE